MEGNYCYKKRTPFVERETFNNTILLLTMVKSKYYYIVSFSAECNIIRVAFDFESVNYGIVTEHLQIDISSDLENVLLEFESVKLPKMDTHICSTQTFKGSFNVDEKITYCLKLKKDNLVPLSVEQMNEGILLAKKEIIEFLESVF